MPLLNTELFELTRGSTMVKGGGFAIDAETRKLWLHANKIDDLSFLQDLRDLSVLTLHRVREGQLDNVASHLNHVETLVLFGVQATSLGFIADMPALKSLLVLSATKLTTLTGLKDAPGLTRLCIENIPRVTNLDALAGATGLVNLQIETLVSQTSRQYFDSFYPLASCVGLESAAFIGIATRDHDLQAFRGLPRLRSLLLADFFPLEQVARLAGARPDLDGLDPISSLDFPCDRCGSDELLLTGSRRRFACSVCDAQRVDRHRTDWNHWRAVGALESTV